MGTGVLTAGSNPAMDKHLIQGRGGGGVEILLRASYHLDLGHKPRRAVSYADFTVPS